MHLARAVFATAAPLSLVENPYWKKFFAAIRPAFKPPNRQMMSNTLLEEVYAETSCKVQEVTANAASVGLLCDGWSNVRYV